jgi:hypothetical protein
VPEGGGYSNLRRPARAAEAIARGEGARWGAFAGQPWSELEARGGEEPGGAVCGAAVAGFLRRRSGRPETVEAGAEAQEASDAEGVVWQSSMAKGAVVDCLGQSTANEGGGWRLIVHGRLRVWAEAEKRRISRGSRASIAVWGCGLEVRAKRASKMQMVIGLCLCFVLLCFRISHVFVLRSAMFYGAIYCLRVQS